MKHEIQGHQVIELLKISPAELLELIKSGLQANNTAGDRVYDKGNNTWGPSQCEREEAFRKWSINETRKNRISFGAIGVDDHVSEFPERWHGIDFSPPKDADGEREFWDNILSLYFVCDDIEAIKKRELPSKGRSFLPCREGTKWSEVKITVIDNEHVRICTPNEEETFFHYSEIQLSDKRQTGKPQNSWTLLLALASTERPAIKNLLKEISRLNLHLQKIFGIKESAFKPYNKYKGCVPNFHLSDKRSVSLEKKCLMNQKNGYDENNIDETQSLFDEERGKWGEDKLE